MIRGLRLLNKDPRFERIARQCNQPRALVTGAWTSLLCLASDSPVRGALYLAPAEAYTLPEIAAYAGLDPAALAPLLDAFRKYSLLELVGDAWCILGWSDQQYESDLSTPRVRAYRRRQKGGK